MWSCVPELETCWCYCYSTLCLSSQHHNTSEYKYYFFTILNLQVLHRDKGHHFHLSLQPCQPVLETISRLMLEFHCLVKAPCRLWDLIYACPRGALSQRHPHNTFSLSPQISIVFSHPSPLLFLCFYSGFRPISNIFCLLTNSEETAVRLPGAFSGNICALMASPFQLCFSPPSTLQIMLTYWKCISATYMSKGLQVLSCQTFPFTASHLPLSSHWQVSGVWILPSWQHLVLSSHLSSVK